jgi:hypothetical protein
MESEREIRIPLPGRLAPMIFGLMIGSMPHKVETNHELNQADLANADKPYPHRSLSGLGMTT